MNILKGFRWAVAFCACTLLLASCSVPMKKGQTWLDSHTGKSELNVSGLWSCPEFSMVQLNQNGREITGTFYGGGFIKGTVSGNSIYLLIHEDDQVLYMAELKSIDKDNINGKYIDARNWVKEEWEEGIIGRRMRLIRMPPR